MTRIVREVVVPRPPDDVFRLLVDPEARRAWVLNFDESPAGPLAVGSRIPARRRDAASRSRYEFVVTALDPGRRLALDAYRNGDLTMRGAFEVRPHPEGALVRSEQELQVKGLLRVAAMAMLPKVEAEMDRELASLRRVALERARA